MLIERMRKRLAADTKFIEPCFPSPADKPPSGSNWVHEIKHDGFRLMARRNPMGIRLITRKGNDWTQRYPLVVEAVNHLKVRSCLIDGEVVYCDEKGVAASHVLCAILNSGVPVSRVVGSNDQGHDLGDRYRGLCRRRIRLAYSGLGVSLKLQVPRQDYFGEVSHSIQTDSVIRRTLCGTRGRCCGGGNVTRWAVPALCRGKKPPADWRPALGLLHQQLPRRANITS